MNRILVIAEHLDGKLNAAVAKCVSCATAIPDADISVAVLAVDGAAVAAAAAATGVSPRTRNPRSNAPSWAADASPRTTSVRAASASSMASERRAASAVMARWSGERASVMGRARGASGPREVTGKKPRSPNRDKGLRLARGVRLRLSFSLTNRPFLAVLHYDGGEFLGWQRQPTGRTVEAELEAVLERLTGRRTPAVGAGRTDTGVHALGQGAGFSLPERWSAEPARAIS